MRADFVERKLASHMHFTRHSENLFLLKKWTFSQRTLLSKQHPPQNQHRQTPDALPKVLAILPFHRTGWFVNWRRQNCRFPGLPEEPTVCPRLRG